jgi:hypothetical protein
MPDYGRDTDIGFPTDKSDEELKRMRRALELLLEQEVTPADVNE